MLVEIKKDIFENEKFVDVLRIIGITTEIPPNSIPRYNLFIDYEEMEGLPTYDNLPLELKDIIKREFDAAIEATPKRKIFISNEPGCFCLEEANRYLKEKILIVLENNLNDGYFLDAIFRNFDIKELGKSRLLHYIDNGWLSYENAGGFTNILNSVKREEKKFDHLVAKYFKNVFSYLRIFVLMDSDKNFENNPITYKENIKQKLESKNYKVHILKKRAMENYMPNEAIQNLLSEPQTNDKTKKWIQSYTYLNDEQKDYLNFEKGFPKIKNEINRERDNQKNEIKQLYVGISDTNYEILDDGIGFSNFKTEFPKLFHGSFAHKNNLLTREGGMNGENEFLEIIKKINKLL